MTTGGKPLIPPGHRQWGRPFEGPQARRGQDHGRGLPRLVREPCARSIPTRAKRFLKYTDYDKNGNLKGDEKYSWCKAPRYDGLPYEVGPLARMVVAYAQGHKEIKGLIDGTLKQTGLPGDGPVLHAWVERPPGPWRRSTWATISRSGSMSSSKTSRPAIRTDLDQDAMSPRAARVAA